MPSGTRRRSSATVRAEKMGRSGRSVTLARLIGCPSMIHEDYLDQLMEMDPSAFMFLFDFDGPARRLQIQNGVGIINVDGPLFSRGAYWRGVGYPEIRRQFDQALASEDVRTIVFDIDSPGGEVSGCFDLVDHIYEARGQKPIIAVANDGAMSAGYALASAADQIYLSRTGTLGSIGVLARHLDTSERDAKLGYRYTTIKSAPRKNQTSSDGPLTPEALKDVHKEVMRLGDLFVDTVARNRELDVEDIHGLEGGLVHGPHAIDAGLADGIATIEEVLGVASQVSTSVSVADALERRVTMTEQEKQKKAEEEAAAKKAEEEAAAKKAEEEAEAAKKASASNVVDIEEARRKAAQGATEAARAHASEVNDLCKLAGKPELAGAFIAEGKSTEDVRKALLEAKAKETSTTTHSAHGDEGTKPKIDSAQDIYARRAGRS